MAEAHGYPTDPERELALGRIAVWLDVEDVKWLIANDLCGDGHTGRHSDMRCGRIRWRADVALDKAGHKSDGQAAQGEAPD